MALAPAERRDYAVAGVVAPLLRQAGWDVRFPYSYGERRYVTAFAHRYDKVDEKA